MISAAVGYKSRFQQTISLMVRHWQTFILLPAIVGFLTTILLLPLSLVLNRLIIQWISAMPYWFGFNLLLRILIIIIATIPIFVGNVITVQSSVLALKQLDEAGTVLKPFEAVAKSLKNLLRYLQVAIYTFLYVYAPLLIILGISLLLLAISAVLTLFNINIITFIGGIFGTIAMLTLAIGCFVGIVLILNRTIRTFFTLTFALLAPISIKDALQKSLQITQKYWRKILAHIGLLIILGLALNIVLDTILYPIMPITILQIVDGIVWAISNTFLASSTYILLKALQQAENPI